MKRSALRSLAIILLLFIVPSCLFAITFDTKLTGITTHPDFWLGLFPSSFRCFIGVEGLELVSDRVTEAGLELATGTIARTLSQNPVTGAILDDSESTINSNKNYDVTYASWKIGIAQGLGWSDQTDFDLLTLRFTLDGQWEVALDPLMQISRTGYPFKNIAAFSGATEGEVLAGTPDLSGNRQLLSMGFDLYGKLSDQLLSVGILDGLSAEFKFVWAPSFMTLSKSYGGFADYWKIWGYAEYAKMIHQKTLPDGKNKWSLGIANAFEVRILGGKYVPEYARTLKSNIWWYEPENMTFLAKDTLKINYYGEQFFGNCVPYIYLFLDMNYSGGKLNNCVEDYIASAFECSTGIHIELQMFSALHIYYEIGGILKYTGENENYKTGLVPGLFGISFSLPYVEGADWSI